MREAGALLKSAQLSVSEMQGKEGDSNYCTDHNLRIQQFVMARLSKAMLG